MSKVSGSDGVKPCHFQYEGTESSSKFACLLAEHLNIRANVAAVQETHSICAADSRVLKNDFAVASAYSSRGSVGVSLLVGRSLNAGVNIVFAGDRGLLVVIMLPLKASSWLRFIRPIPL